MVSHNHQKLIPEALILWPPANKADLLVLAHILSFVIRVPDAEMVGLGFKSLGLSIGDLGFSLGEVTEKLYISNSKDNMGTPLPISLRCLE